LPRLRGGGYAYSIGEYTYSQPGIPGSGYTLFGDLRGPRAGLNAGLVRPLSGMPPLPPAQTFPGLGRRLAAKEVRARHLVRPSTLYERNHPCQANTDSRAVELSALHAIAPSKSSMHILLPRSSRQTMLLPLAVCPKAALSLSAVKTCCLPAALSLDVAAIRHVSRFQLKDRGRDERRRPHHLRHLPDPRI
jgi:hypothetical protein